jgi:hypothetical protein
MGNWRTCPTIPAVLDTDPLVDVERAAPRAAHKGSVYLSRAHTYEGGRERRRPTDPLLWELSLQG